MKRLTLTLLSALSLVIGGAAVAQEKYPSKPVRIIVPYAPGGATDIISRLVAEQLKNNLGQAFVVESKPGAFGVPAIEEMARSRPDGHTLFVGNVSTNAITPVLFEKKLSNNYERDVVSVGRLATLPSFLITTTKNFPPKSVAELVAHAKANPDKVRYGSAGVGSFPHFDMEIFATATSRPPSSTSPRQLRMCGPATCGRSRCSPRPGSPNIRTFRHSPKPAIRASARCTGRACSLRRRRPRT